MIVFKLESSPSDKICVSFSSVKATDKTFRTVIIYNMKSSEQIFAVELDSTAG